MAKGYHSNHRRASTSSRWQRDKLVSSHGYSKIRVGIGHPLADPNGYAYEHLVVWVSAGRLRPRKDQVLKFRNEDRGDCRLQNLYVASRAESNRIKNAKQLRDPRGRVLSVIATRIVRAGATVTTVRR